LSEVKKETLRIAICAETQPLVAYALSVLLSNHQVKQCRPSVTGCAECCSGETDLVLQYAPSTYCLPLHEKCRNKLEGVPVVFMSLAWIETEEAIRQAGLSGYLGPGCSPQQIAEAINTVSNGGFIYHPGNDCGIKVGFLTERQVQVLKMVGKGLTDQEIASQLGVLPTTVRHHLDTLHRKLKLPRRGELIALATLGGLTKPEASSGTPIQKRPSKAPTAENLESMALAK